MSSSNSNVEYTIAEGYSLRHGYPPLPAYRHLRVASGMSAVRPDQAEGVAAGSWFGCYVVEDTSDTPVAMGRIVGDGAWYFHLADMATLPEHQRKGLGSIVMHALLTRIKEKAPAGALVTLIADPPGWPLYTRFKFVDVAGYPGASGKGMFLRL